MYVYACGNSTTYPPFSCIKIVGYAFRSSESSSFFFSSFLSFLLSVFFSFLSLYFNSVVLSLFLSLCFFFFSFSWCLLSVPLSLPVTTDLVPAFLFSLRNQCDRRHTPSQCSTILYIQLTHCFQTRSLFVCVCVYVCVCVHACICVSEL